jgi:hypothetical protein
VHEELLRKEIFRLAQFVRDADTDTLEGKPVPAKKDELHYESPRLVYRKIGSSTNERTLISTVVDEQICLGESLNYLTPLDYSTSKSLD